MQYTINELRTKIFSHVYDVYEVFQNYFGEAFVDLQDIPDDDRIVDAIYACTDIGEIEAVYPFELSEADVTRISAKFGSAKPNILIWWPRVTITNENDKSVQIQDLYAKVSVTIEGKIPWESRGFYLTRTTFSEIQYSSGYLHSHIPHFSGIPHFDTPCLGTGPINNTIMDLKNDYEETLWMLFCEELARYVTVESLSGGPYFRMETIGASKRLIGYSDYSEQCSRIEELAGLYNKYDPENTAIFKEITKRFALYYLQHGHLSFNYKDGLFIQGMPYFDYMIDISNAFIDFYNQSEDKENVNNLYERGIVIKAVVSNGQFYRNNSTSTTDYSVHEGTHILTFKGESKCLKIERDEENIREEVLLLNNKIAMFILHNVLKIINYRYRNEHTRQNRGNQDVTSTYKTVAYL